MSLVIHTVRKLARELHRRSVWQVLVGYLVLSWVVQLTVEGLTEAVGLPSWTPVMAFVLLAVGLPIVLMTALSVGGGPGWLRMTDEVDPNELVGRTPDEVHVVPEAHPLYGAGLFTWRNAILGGVMAGALLVTSVTAYLAMWSLGIGPVGSLMARGLLAEGDTVLVADFVDRAGDGAAARLTELVRAELSRSSVVAVLGSAATATLLGGLGPRADDARLLEIARRANVRAVVTGEVASDLRGYRVVARIVLPEGGVVAAHQQVVGAGEESVGGHALATKLRERLGESLRSIREGDAPEAGPNGAESDGVESDGVE